MRVICSNCQWRGEFSEILTAPNPFVDGDKIHGCPECFDVNTILTACEEPGCGRWTVAGTPTPGGYRQTCDEHRPKRG